MLGEEDDLALRSASEVTGAKSLAIIGSETGVAVASDLTSSGSYQYTARRFDAETTGSANQPSGLYYYCARMYSPALGRFLQPDPSCHAAGANLYVYVNNDPLNLVDPSGLAAERVGEAVSSAGQYVLTHPSEVGGAIGGRF